MSQENNDTVEQPQFTVEEVFTILGRAGIGKKHLADLAEKAEQTPENFKTPQQFGNALKTVVKSYGAGKFGEGQRKAATETENLLEAKFPHLDFSAASNQEEYFSIISEKTSQQAEDKESASLTDGQIEALPRVQKLKQELETFKQKATTLEGQITTVEQQAEQQMVGMGYWKAMNPSLSQDPLRRANQERNFANAVKSISVKRDEQGRIVYNSEGFPIVVDEAGAEAIDPVTNNPITFQQKVKAISPVDFIEAESTPPSTPNPTDKYKDSSKGIVYSPNDKKWNEKRNAALNSGDHATVLAMNEAEEQFHVKK